MADNQFSAGAQAIGYLYQARYALHLILQSSEETKLSIEGLDDIEFEEGTNPIELLQLKHHTKEASLTDHSADLWKTIRVWSTYAQDGRIQLGDTLFTLVTTAKAKDDSIAALLQPEGNNRDAKIACQKLITIAQTSENESLQKAFAAFTSLTPEKRGMLIESIHVLDASPNICDTGGRIKDRIKFAVSAEHLEGLYERLEGWWFGKVVSHLSGGSEEVITATEVHNKIVDIAEEFRPDSLPIDYANAQPPSPPDPERDNRYFVLQLKAIALQNKRIEKAIIDYYRAFEQRSRWVREELLVSDDLEQYEKKLVDEWERHRFAAEDENVLDVASGQELEVLGRYLYKWMEFEADIRIRQSVTERYVMRGSYHMLADEDPPRVWWHLKFIERLEQLLKIY